MLTSRKMVPFVVAAIAGAGARASLDIGETTIPLGEDAFAAAVLCLNTDRPCGGLIAPNSGPPDYEFIGLYTSLTASHILDSVFVDLADEDIIRVVYPVPILNGPGDDLYLGQAQFLGNDLGFGNAAINGFMISVDNMATWHHVPPTAFTPDSIETSVPFWYADEGPVEGEPYALWYATVDLGSFNVAPGQSIQSLWISAADVGSLGTEKLDIVTVANLNTEPGCPGDLTGDGVLDLADISAFIIAFISQDPAADLAFFYGVFDLADVNAFISAFETGCP